MMTLSRFRVTHFRSIIDTGWVDCDETTTLVGINESGKSNVLLALWKLNPARGGEIDPLHDLPVTELSEYRDQLGNVPFVEAVFALGRSAETLSTELKISFSPEDELYLQRWYDGHYSWHFIAPHLQAEIDALRMPYIDADGNEQNPRFTDTQLFDLCLEKVPTFVYYSNYGNLASRIYLPHAIKWLKGQEVPGIPKNEDQIRTIRVLFDYVKLSPDEIWEDGKDAIDIARARSHNAEPNQDEIQKARAAKEKRSLLLQSAGTKLTKDFHSWWNQGEYTFRFQADGDYFQIWVSDSKRPAEVDLELRSTGLQWFLSFYLVFLVESQNDNAGAILLLDEAGLTLHPLAQKDLSQFFNKLSEHNQIINTTHSPFIIDTESIDRCRVVYSDENGYTVVSDDLRKGAGEAGSRSVYAVHAALGLTVSDVMLQGCQIIIVEGISDQYYLSAIKNLLLREGRIKPRREMVFAPAGGVKGIPGITGLVSAKNEALPLVLLDSDSSGEAFRDKLLSTHYKECRERILEIKTFTGLEGSEIEDIIPFKLIEKHIEWLLASTDPDEEFEHDDSKPLIPQIEAYASAHGIILKKGWKVELAKFFKKHVFAKKAKPISEDVLDRWTQLFEKFLLE